MLSAKHHSAKTLVTWDPHVVVIPLAGNLTSLNSVLSNDGSRTHGAGDHENKREKRKCDSVNKDNNGKGFLPI